MLEIKPICEHCKKSLPNDSSNAMICTFECTFCSDCVDQILNNVCIHYSKPINTHEFALKLKHYKNIIPNKR